MKDEVTHNKYISQNQKIFDAVFVVFSLQNYDFQKEKSLTLSNVSIEFEPRVCGSPYQCLKQTTDQIKV